MLFLTCRISLYQNQKIKKIMCEKCNFFRNRNKKAMTKNFLKQNQNKEQRFALNSYSF